MRFVPLLSALLAVVAGKAMAADLIVVEARGSGLHAGQRIADDRKLVLKDGERVVLIGPDGRTYKLSGPFDKEPAAAAGDEATSLVTAFEALRTQKQARLSQAGVVRTATARPDLPTPWIADVLRNGNVCLKKDAPLVFWRTDVMNSTSVALSPADRTWRAHALWPAGQAVVQLPSLFPIRDRGAYVVRTGDNEVAITINVIPAAVASERMQAAWMVEKGCVAQAEALIRSIQ